MHRNIAIALVVALVVAALPCAASTFLARTPEELAADSTAVVTGKVVSIESFWDESHTIIVSEIVLEVERTVVGQAPKFVTLRLAGGTVDDYTMVAHGFPTFTEGERALVFVGPDTKVAERFRVTGYQQGHYRIVPNRFGEEIAIPTVDHDVQLVGAGQESTHARKPVRLIDFEQRLRDAARNQHFTLTQ